MNIVEEGMGEFTRYKCKSNRQNIFRVLYNEKIKMDRSIEMEQTIVKSLRIVNMSYKMNSIIDG